MNRSPSRRRRCAPSPRTASEIRKRTAARRRRAVGWNWTNSMSRTRRAGPVGDGDPVAGRPRRVGRAGDTARRRRRWRAASSARARAAARRGRAPRRRRSASPSPTSAIAAVCSSTWIRGSCRHPGDQRARRSPRRWRCRRHAGCGGGCDRPRGRARTRRRVAVEPHSEPLRSPIRAGPVVDQHAHRVRVAQPAARRAACPRRAAPGRRRRPIAAAMPPWAMNELDARSEPLVTSATRAPRAGGSRAA